MIQKKKYVLPVLLLLLLQAAVPPSARAVSMRTGGQGIELICRYENFSSMPYQDAGGWYIGYGTQIRENAYPNGISEEEAVRLLRSDLADIERDLNAFFTEYKLSPTQAQFDALADFAYELGTSWLSGSSQLRKIVSGDIEASRRETVRAFGVWSHSGGVVLPALAERRLEEAALYLDGSTENREQYAYIAVNTDKDVVYSTDFAVYERGGEYDAFPLMFRLGCTLAGVRTEDGTLLRLGDTVPGNRSGTAVWEENSYNGTAYQDVTEADWFYHYVMELSEKGVISGRGKDLYAPNEPVKTGEALKLLLLAAGHEEQSASETHWAGGYAAYALERGFLPAYLLSDLEKPISRLDVAQLAAKALGFGQSFSDSPFEDTDDGFVTAMAGIGVLTGNTEGGKKLFHPERALTRAEVSGIVWRLRNLAALGTKQTFVYASRTMEAAQGVPFNSYRKTSFSGNGVSKSYAEAGVRVLRGIDVSRHQESIDWTAVRNDGIEFAILRVGGRYQNNGDIFDDACFEEYYAGASAAGLRLGVYFYSQAVNTAEALEEADYVLNKLSDKPIDGPIVFDWETAGSGNPRARSNNVPVSVVCDCAAAFCERVKAAGYAAMVYMNTYDGYIKYDLSRLAGYDVWYAGQYNGAYPRFLYDFQLWQYTDSGSVNGIKGKVDMDLWFIRSDALESVTETTAEPAAPSESEIPAESAAPSEAEASAKSASPTEIETSAESAAPSESESETSPDAANAPPGS